jgi:hypothetical protein
MKKLLLVLLLCSTSARADSDWVLPLFGGVLLGNAIASRPYYVPPPVYYAPPVYYQQPPVYYQPQPQIYYSNEYYRERELRRMQRDYYRHNHYDND